MYNTNVDTRNGWKQFMREEYGRREEAKLLPLAIGLLLIILLVSGCGGSTSGVSNEMGAITGKIYTNNDIPTVACVMMINNNIEYASYDTDTTGEYYFNVPINEYELIVSKQYYKTKTISIEIKRDTIILRDIYLEPVRLETH